MENRPLKLEDIVTNPSHRRQERRIRLLVSRLHGCGRHTQRVGRQRHTIEFPRVPQHRTESLRTHVTADGGDHLLRRQRFAEHLQGLRPPALAHQVSLAD